MVKKTFAGKLLVFALVIGMAMPLALSRSVAAEEGPTTSISVNPFGFIGWGPDIEFETLLTGNGALVVRGKYSSWSLGDWTNTGLGGGIGWRWYPNSVNSAKGLWIGPSFNYLNITAEYQDVEPVSSGIMSFLLQFGYKWVLGSPTGFVLSPYIDLGYGSGKIKTTDIFDNEQTLEFSGVAFGLGLAVGISF